METTAPVRPARRGNKLLLVIVLLLLGVGAAGYLWYARIQADAALEDATLEELQKITVERPNSARAFHYLGLRLNNPRTRTIKPKEALEAHLRATQLAPDDEEIWAAAIGATNEVNRAANGPAAAFQLANDFLKRHPDSVKIKQERESLLATLKRGTELYTSGGHYAEAIQSYRYWLAEEPNNAEAQQGLKAAEEKLAAENKTKEEKP